jgi:hypothetical protein
MSAVYSVLPSFSLILDRLAGLRHRGIYEILRELGRQVGEETREWVPD